MTREISPTRDSYSNSDSSLPNTPLKSSPTGSGVAKRFPRPQSGTTSIESQLSSRVSAHIASATSRRPPSPLKHSTSASEDSNAEEGILPNFDGTELAKVYGSVLQPKETLDSFNCAICLTPFPPDATIYPDPSTLSSSGVAMSSTGTQFLCRSCFTVCGGSKGDCPSCHRPVLILKSEGGFVEAGGAVWHKKCFCCDGCLKNIGDNPMVDLLGRPSCAECFDTCLKRPSKDSHSTPTRNSGNRSNLGGSKRTSSSREASPALEELEQRLGILRTRDPTPTTDERNKRPGTGTKSKDPQRSPITSRYNPSSVESSPTLDRLAARARANSAASYGSPSAVRQTTSSPSNRILSRYKSPEPESSADEASPLRARRSYSRLTTPDPDDGSPGLRRAYTRFEDSDATTSSTTSRQPTEAAIEEMKRRFLNQASPSPSPSAKLPSTVSPQRRRSRSRSKPRISDTSPTVTTNTPRSTPQRDKERRSSTTPRLRTSLSTSSLRSALRPQTTGETDFVLRPEPTGESTAPLVRDKTGTTEFSVRRDTTGDTSYLPRQATGNTDYLPSVKPLNIRRQHTGGTEANIQPQKTGETLVFQRTGETEYQLVRQPTGEIDVATHITGQTLYPHRTGDSEGPVRRHRTGETPIQPQRTGDTTYTHLTSDAEPPVRRQRTGEKRVSIQHTGEGERSSRRKRHGESEVRRQRTGETDIGGAVRRHRTGETEERIQMTGVTDYSLRRDRNGDAEVESLLGTIQPEVPDLIDLRSADLTPPRPANVASKIPLPVRSSTSRVSDHGIRVLDSSTSLRRGYDPPVPVTPDLASDMSDTMSTRSSGPTTPPSVSPPSRRSRDSFGSEKRSSLGSQYTGVNDSTPTSRSKKSFGSIDIPDQLPADTRCAGCRLPLFNTKHGGKFVSVPVEPTSTGSPPKTYHTSCFRCNVCGDAFEEREGGHAVFVRGEEGACHVKVSNTSYMKLPTSLTPLEFELLQCAPPEKITLRQQPIVAPKLPRYTPSPSSRSSPSTVTATFYSSSRYERPPPSAPATSTPFASPQPRFGGSSACPGCHKAVLPMDRGIVPGPQATKWHGDCLSCGGREAKGRRKQEGVPGCGKKLDSAAKTDIEGRVWCRECMVCSHNVPVHHFCDDMPLIYVR